MGNGVVMPSAASASQVSGRTPRSANVVALRVNSLVVSLAGVYLDPLWLNSSRSVVRSGCDYR